MTCGIYLIENKKTQQKYIGQSNNIERRIREHVNRHDETYIDRVINKYGIDNFNIKIIEELPKNKDKLDAREKYWIQYYNTFKNKRHYNLTPGGDFCPSLVPEIAKKISEKNKGKKHTKEYKEKLSQSMIKKGIHQGEKNPFYGKTHTLESRKKMSESHKGKKRKPHSKNTKQKISDKQKKYQDENKIYTLWDIHCCSYDKYAMTRNNREPNPCGCFKFQYNGKNILSSRFIDFITPQILYDLTEKFLIG